MHDPAPDPSGEGRSQVRQRFGLPLPETRFRLVLMTVGVLLLAAALLGVIARTWTPGRSWTLGVSAFSPYLMLGAPVAAITTFAARQWIVGLVAIGVFAVCFATQFPLYVAASAPHTSPKFVTMTANLRLGAGSAEAVVAAVRRHGVDALMLQELTAEEQGRLAAAGLDAVLPYHVSEPRPYAYGTGLWSRYPLSDANLRHDFTCSFATATAIVPGTDVKPTLAAVHLAGPWPKVGHWLYDVKRMAEALSQLAAQNSTVLVGGDFNATPDVRQFRRLLTRGFGDAADQAGAGMTRTYPSNRWFPPLIAIDHILTRGAIARSAATIEIPGSDHRALVVSMSLTGRT